jgi:hypothetical protein
VGLVGAGLATAAGYNSYDYGSSDYGYGNPYGYASYGSPTEYTRYEKSLWIGGRGPAGAAEVWLHGVGWRR